MRDYIRIATDYANDVVSGKIIACKWVILACKRFNRDIQDSSFPFYLDAKAAAKAAFFVENQKHLKGRLAGSLIELAPWQAFIIVNAFGFLHKAGPKAGMRRFRKVYIEVARGNGKSCLSSAIALYMSAPDGEGGAEVYSAATTRDQAGIVFKDAQKMVRCMDPAMRRRFGFVAHAMSITANNNSLFKALSSQGNSLDGLNIHFACVDELHAHKSREVWDVLVTGLGKRDQSMIWAITTSGSDIAGICYSVHKQVKEILNNVKQDETFFGIIFTVDDSDDWQSETAIIKSNPNFGISVDRELILSLLSTAQTSSDDQFAYKTKHLDIWTTSKDAFFNMDAWNNCLDPTLKIEDYEDWDAFIGVDLSTRIDLSALALVFRKGDRTVCFPTYYVPEKAIHDAKNASYKGWKAEKRLDVCDGDTVGYAHIEKHILELYAKYKVKAIALDKYEASYLIQRLQGKLKGNVVFVVRQGAVSLSEPMKELDVLTREGRFSYNCPILQWMASNTVPIRDNNENIKPGKERFENKIDGISALVTAMAVMLGTPEKVKRNLAEGIFWV